MKEPPGHARLGGEGRLRPGRLGLPDRRRLVVYATAATIRAERQRVHDHTAATRAERQDPDHDTALQHALRRERHRQDVADRQAVRDLTQQSGPTRPRVRRIQ
ncbi:MULTISPECIES: hypothetical protein [Kitasatospora]|uniref:Uncharacterized protein n=1 Tax=Kitasatospora cathayae TaxID=3004092 RepID=A0ABY7QEI0_9ACTN|nr:hypothetical protein [Kitasatospora sp. HUAS 3-15]WBP91173.1 hypothetical protein O1G21_38375 [Kitasatospora sp. HUAS 3-15]